MNTKPSRPLTIDIACPASGAYKFIHNPENLPKWATAFVKDIRQEGGKWIMTTVMGEAGVRFCPDNELGVVDHYVGVAPGQEIHVPMRVLPAGEGCVVQFTLFREPDMDDARFESDAATVMKDLGTLKKVLENESG